MPTDLLTLPANQVTRFYAGGPRIAKFRGQPANGDRSPEDWVGSTVSVFGATDGAGLTRLPNGRYLRDLVTESPLEFLGEAHQAAFGDDPCLLVKLLDTGERIPVHVHPDGAFAKANLGLKFGKAEAWVFIETAPEASVHLGFSRHIAWDELLEWSATQDTAAILGAMNEVPVSSGEAIFVPPGTPHVIGDGLLLVELQQPSDLSILLEWKGILPEREAYLGLERSIALRAMDRTAVTRARLAALRTPAAGSVLSAEAADFFRATWATTGSTLDDGFSIIIVVEGHGKLTSEHGGHADVTRGHTLLVPAAAGRCELSGDLRVLCCRPPAPPPNVRQTYEQV